MSNLCSSGLLAKNSTVAFIEFLEDGLYSIKRVHEVLIEEDVDLISGQCSIYNYIRKQIVQAKQSLERSEQAASAVLRILDNNIEIFTQDAGKLEREMSNTKQTLDNLKIKQKSNKKLLSDSEGALRQSRTNLSSTRERLQRQEVRRENATTVRNFGLRLIFIPIVGWVVGPAMMIAGAIDMSQASDAIREAETEVRALENDVEKYKSKVLDYEAKILQNESNIKQKHYKEKQIHEEIWKVKQQREAVAEFQMKMRRAVFILSGLSGKASVAEIQTRKSILQEPVKKVIEDLMKAAEEITGKQLGFGVCRPRQIHANEENQKQDALLSVCFLVFLMWIIYIFFA
ncbi:uncharacterized protein LOC108441226 [Pygocentrus nattereri]|uniref:uncharacterized protein LOC108441226 n=1 Tax=Pygocentrus nattereri TaxID=42514 RepID=UPI0008142515|nr:uncharacterized protein LOC108441226 [Pygocentrus nattereri]